ncbi:MAG: phage BR0599 family protein [Deltaproteobacteria bacterium]|nr:phage BR0599 family protein [Deltaproteobacteria bacterium]
METSQPREGIEIILPAVTYRLATGTRDLVINGQTFKAMAGNRSGIQIAHLEGRGEVTLSLPAAHPFVAKYMAGGVPPRLVLINIHRKQAGGEVQTMWRGHVASMTFADHVANFSVPSRPIAMLARRLPTFTVGRSCGHILYDSNCRVLRASFQVTTTVVSANGRIVNVASMGVHPDSWAQFGEVLHVLTGERMTIVEQIGTTITVQQPIGEIKTGDAVEVYAGCDHTIGTCRDKFANVPNFGGLPNLPVSNPFFRNGLGRYQSGA